MSDQFTFENDDDRKAFWAMILKLVNGFSPTCSDYQLWRGTFGQEMEIKYRHGLYPVLKALKEAGLITASKHPDYPHFVYAITEDGNSWLQIAENLRT